MPTKTLNFTPTSVKLNKEPYVLLPLKKWQELEDLYEDYLMVNSPELQKELKEAEKEIERGEFVTYEELRKELNLN